MQETAPARTVGKTKSTLTATQLRLLLARPEPKSQAELTERMREDYQVKLADLVLRSEIASVDVQISAADESAEWLAEHCRKLWQNKLPEMLECIPDGRVAWEKDWTFQAGRTLIADLISMPVSHTKMLLDQKGNFAGIEVSIGEDAKTIKPQSAWWLSLDPTAKHPYGRSLYQGAPMSVWRERQEAIRLRRLLISKFVIQGIIGRAPAQVTLENGQVQDGIQAMLDACDALLSGGSMVLPQERDAQGNPTHEILQYPTVNSPAALDAHIDGLDQEQLQAFGIPPKTVLEGTSGSYAMVVAQRRVLDAVVDSILKQIETSFQRYVIEKMCLANGLPKNAVTVSHEALVTRANQLLYDILMAVLANDQLATALLAGAIDIEQVMKMLKVPLTGRTKAVLQQILQGLARQQEQAAKPQPAAQPNPAPQ